MANQTYGAIKLSDANAVGQVLVKKMGGSGYAPKDWADVINLMGKLPERTVSGSIANFSDGADDVPVRAVTCTVNPNLSGVSSINLMQTKKNLIKPDKYQTASNNLALGQTDGTSFGTFLKAGTYTISYTTSGETCYIYRRESNDSSNTNMGKKLSATFTLESEGNFRFWLYGDGAVLSNISNVQIEVGSSATAYEAYTAPTVTNVPLGRTIYGGSADVVTGEGTDEYALIPLDSNITWDYRSDNKVFRSSVLDFNSIALCSCFNVETYSHVYNNAEQYDNCISINSTYNRLYVSYQDANGDVSALQTYLSGQKLVIKKATPETFTFDPITPTPHTSLGTNNLWNDRGNTQLTYRRDIDLALNSGSSLLGFGLGNPNVGQESEE